MASPTYVQLQGGRVALCPRASKFANAFIGENSVAFDDLKAAIDEAPGALSEDSLGADGRTWQAKRVKQWTFASAEAHLFSPKRTPLAEHVHFDGGAGQLHMALSVASCRRLSVFDTRGPPAQFCAASLHGDGLLDDYECVRTFGLHP